MARNINEIINTLECMRAPDIPYSKEDLIEVSESLLVDIYDLRNMLLAVRECNDNGEMYNSPTADSAQALANLLELVPYETEADKE